VNGKKIIAVFGACGERDRGKRPLMGEIVSDFADYLIITNEDPYGEDPQQIIDEVFSGVIKSGRKTEGKNCWREPDRQRFPRLCRFRWSSHETQLFLQPTTVCYHALVG
jgi:UDP-N-acetylmuramyl tripeptide synthase